MDGVRCQMLNTLTDRSAAAAQLNKGKQGYYEQVSAFARNVFANSSCESECVVWEYILAQLYGRLLVSARKGDFCSCKDSKAI